MSVDLGPTRQPPQVQAVVPRFWSLPVSNAPLPPSQVGASVEQVVCCAPPGVPIHGSVIIGLLTYCRLSSVKVLFGRAGAGGRSFAVCVTTSLGLGRQMPHRASLSHGPSLSQTET